MRPLRALRSLAGRLVALCICAIASALPFRARARFAALLRALSRVTHPRESRLFRFQVKFWNHVVLGFVFYGGFPLVRLLMPLWGKGRFAPRAGSPSYWIRRPDPAEYDRDVEDPF